MSRAFLFPGQGSQKIGMADQILGLTGAQERFELASKLIGRDLLAICQGNIEGKDKSFDLNDTRNTQPALFVIESILVDCLKKIPNCDLQLMGEESKIVFKNNFDSLITNKKLNKIYKQYI